MTTSLSQVRGTNDSCTVSKSSMAKLGYVEDPFVVQFVEKVSRRSPLIHRGYYARHKCLELCVNGAMAAVEMPFQVLSLGGGFDSRFFLLATASSSGRSSTLGDCRYFEVDFPEVLDRKRKLIELDGETKRVGDLGLRLCPADLRDLPGLEKDLESQGFLWSVPTVIIAECSITYMPLESAEALLRWTAAKLENAAFILYEQIGPDDGFGRVMINHFASLGSPLHSVHKYPDLESQRRRFLDAGWDGVLAEDVATLWDRSVPLGDKLRIDFLEPFDEFEEFYLKCAHYVVAVAGRGSLGLRMMSNALPAHCSESVPRSECPDLAVKMNAVGAACFPRFSHAAAKLKGGEILVCGGFGEGRQGHSRLSTVQVFDAIRAQVLEVVLNGEQDPRLLMDRMCAALVGIPGTGAAILVGGRRSPARPIAETVKLDYHSERKTVDASLVSRHEAAARWRHVATWVRGSSGKDGGGIFVHGGRRPDKILGDSWLLNPENGEWTEIEVSSAVETPCARHSHAVASEPYDVPSSIYISGGIDGDHTILGDVWRFSFADMRWTRLQVAGYHARFGHQGLLSGNRFLSVGGVSSTSTFLPGVTVVCLDTLVCYDVRLPASSWMFCRHQCVWCVEGCQPDEEKFLVIGGGGNCFSFGTHFNSGILEISVPKL